MITMTATAQFPRLDYKNLNAEAAKEYLSPIRPGYEGRNPYWNGYATRFLYAPAFDFLDVSGASQYAYIVKAGGHEYTFRAAKPNLSLAPIWNDIPAGLNAQLSVVAVDAAGNVTKDTAGTRTFFRDYPFSGPYNVPASTYEECAIKALRFIHSIPQIQKWATQQTPDMSFRMNTYPCKTISATIRCELMLAKRSPADSALAMRIARNAGEFMLRISWTKDSALAYFPPTYYGDYFASAYNKGVTMSMEACKAAQAFLDLYDATGDERYMTQVKGILATYRKLQSADGSIPIKLYTATGKGVNEVCARLHPLLGVLRRMHDQYAINDYEDMRKAAESWMENFAFEKFEMVGQFEDVSVTGLKPYENLSHWTGVPYAIYVLESGKATKQQIEMARDVIDFGEDQFTIWELGPQSLGFGSWLVPAVEEQYFYRMAVDDSAASMAEALLELWRVTGDKLALAKGIALANSLTNIQKPSGLIPTAWENGGSENMDDLWISCCMGDILTLFKYAKYAGEMKADAELAGLIKRAATYIHSYGNDIGMCNDSTAIQKLGTDYRKILNRFYAGSRPVTAAMKDALRSDIGSVERSLVKLDTDGGYYYITSLYHGFLGRQDPDEAIYVSSPDGELTFKKLDKSDPCFIWQIQSAGMDNGSPVYTIRNVGCGAYINKADKSEQLSAVRCSPTPATTQVVQRIGTSQSFTISNTADRIIYNPKLSNNKIVLYQDISGGSWRLRKLSPDYVKGLKR